MSNGDSTLKYVAIGCSLFLLMGCCLGGLGFAGVRHFFGAPHGYAHGYLEDCRQGRFGDALRRMDAPYQNTHDVARFEAAARAVPGLTQHSDATLTNVQIDDETAEISGTLEGPGGSIPIRIRLTEIGEHWYVSAVRAGGVGLQ